MHIFAFSLADFLKIPLKFVNLDGNTTSVCCSVSLSTVSFSRFTVWVRAHPVLHHHTHSLIPLTGTYTKLILAMCLPQQTMCVSAVIWQAVITSCAVAWIRCDEFKDAVNWNHMSSMTGRNVEHANCNHSAFWLINHSWGYNVKCCHTSIQKTFVPVWFCVQGLSLTAVEAADTKDWSLVQLKLS